MTCPCIGQVIRDGTTGPSGSGALAGPDYTITAALGTPVGANLFHSFTRFDLSPGETATFTGPAEVANLLARVTGGAASTIQGTIRAEGMPNVNMIFINPAGVIFGPGASIDIPGSFAVTTADLVYLTDGGSFNATNPGSSILTSALPNAFGFLASPPASIETDTTILESPTGQVISLVGGDLHTTRTTLEAPSGRINLISVASAGRVELDPASPNAPVNTTTIADLGAIEILNKSLTLTSGDPGGRVVIRAGHLHLDSSIINSDTLGSANGQPIAIHTTESLELTNQGRIRTRTSGTGRGGDIEISTGTTHIDSRGFIETDTLTTGPGGNINITTNILTIDGAGLASLTGIRALTQSLTDTGRGGDITIQADDAVNLDANGRIAAISLGASNTGDIRLITNQLTLNDGASVTAQTQGAGVGGFISIDATTINLDGGGTEDSLTSIVADTTPGAPGEGGDILINTKELNVINAAAISANTNGSGDGGSVTVRSDKVLLDGFGLKPFTGIAVNTQAVTNAGDAGSIVIETDTLEVIDAAGVAANTFGDGSGGEIHAIAERLILNDLGSGQGTGISANALDTATGDGGNILIVAGQATLNDGALIVAASSGPGNAGEIQIETDGALNLSGMSTVSSAAQFADSGDILMSARGAISITQSAITASAAANGGNITITSQHSLLGSQATISGRSGGDGAAITLGAPLAVLENSLIDGIAGGRDVLVTINTDALLSSSSQVLTSTAILPPELDLAGTLNLLPDSLLGDRAALQQHCAIQMQVNTSSFSIVGRSGNPIEPISYIPSWQLLTDDNANKPHRKPPHADVHQGRH